MAKHRPSKPSRPPRPGKGGAKPTPDPGPTPPTAGGRQFGDPRPSPDVIKFTNTNEPRVGDRKLQPFAPPRSLAPMPLSQVLGAGAVQAIQAAGQLVFHTVGDTGGVKEPSSQLQVADAMEADFAGPVAANRPSFLFHLGDVVYYFGQKQYYTDQFYYPYRHYPAPIFAIPGNHDGDLFPGEANPVSLAAFLENFCAVTPGPVAESGPYVRTSMDQPGAYFTLVAPFVTIIGAYTNALESPGVITPDQMTWLTDQLKQAGVARSKGQTNAVIVATHHPIYSGDVEHGGSASLLGQFDQATRGAGFVPDLVLSAHVHNFQRFTRRVGAQEVPFLVAGAGGYFNLHRMATLPGGGPIPVPFTPPGSDVTLENYVADRHGYLRITASARYLTGQYFVAADPAKGLATRQIDAFTLDLASRTLTGVKSSGATLG